MNAMPEREVFATELNEQEWLVSYLREAMKMAEKLVPESALLAAERGKQVESERDARRERKVALMECEEREATLRAERDALKSRLKDLEDTLDTYWVNNVNKLKENLKEMEAERQKWIDHAIHVESTLRKEIDVLRTQLESHNA